MNWTGKAKKCLKFGFFRKKFEKKEDLNLNAHIWQSCASFHAPCEHRKISFHWWKPIGTVLSPPYVLKMTIVQGTIFLHFFTTRSAKRSLMKLCCCSLKFQKYRKSNQNCAWEQKMFNGTKSVQKGTKMSNGKKCAREQKVCKREQKWATEKNVQGSKKCAKGNKNMQGNKKMSNGTKNVLD